MMFHRITRRLVPLLVLVVVHSAAVSVASPQADDVPERVILNLTDTPATCMAVTWRTNNEHTDAVVQWSEATNGTGFKKNIQRTAARTEQLQPGNQKIVWYHSAVLSGLKPQTVYVYRVGHDSTWSPWNQFRTAGDGTAPFSFVFFGDPQNDIRQHISRVFREAYRQASWAGFWLFAGDLTTEPEDELVGEWFEAAGFITGVLPSIMVPGNHDYLARDLNGRKVRTDTLPLWRAQFTLPENGIPGLEETSFTVDYQGVRFVMINSNRRLEEQAAWLEGLLANNPNRWTIVSFHHPLYSVGRGRDDRDTRQAFRPLFDKYGVDLVLQGHDHTYARSWKLKNDAVVGEREQGTVYVVSSCGPKFYVYNPLYNDLMAKTGENLQLFQVISIDGPALTFHAYTAAGDLYDAFELRK
jgi:3',5'-cyclic AMP phosphodiesterase CpdA